MKRHQTCLGLTLVAAACTGNSDSATPTTPTPAGETSTPTVPEAPTAAPPLVTDEERIEAAIAQLAGEGPSDTYTYDLLDTKIDDQGIVTLTICAWTGNTVFDTVRDSLYRTTADANDTITATHITTPVCLNTQLIETALDFIDEFDSYWADVSADPASFAIDPRTKDLLTERFESLALELTDGWAADGVYFETASVAGDLPSGIEADMLFRRYPFEETRILEIVLCRPINPTAGAYRDGILIDDGGSDAGPGRQSIKAYQLVPDPAARLAWRMAGDDALIWADCFETGDWVGAANKWRPRDTSLEVVKQ